MRLVRSTFFRRKFLVATVLLSGTAASACARGNASSTDSLDLALEGVVEPRTIVTDSFPVCTECSIELRSDVVLGSTTDPVIVRGVPKVDRAPDGRYYATVFGATHHPIIVYGPDGRYQSSFGSRGQGPGEIVSLYAMAALPDGGVAIGHNYDRLSFFDSKGKFVREIRPALGRIVGITPLPKNKFAVVAASRTPELLGEPVHLINANGERLGPLGGDNIYPSPAIAALRIAAPGHNGTVWVGEIHNYRFVEVDTLNRLRQIIGVTYPGALTIMEALIIGKNVQVKKNSAPKWEPRGKSLTHPPLQEVDGAYVDENGIMWSLIRMPVPNWKELELTYDERWPDENFQTEESKHQQHRAIVHAVDTRTGQLLARRSFDEYGTLTGDGRIVRSTVTAEGYFSVIVSELHLVRK